MTMQLKAFSLAFVALVFAGFVFSGVKSLYGVTNFAGDLGTVSATFAFLLGLTVRQVIGFRGKA